MGWLGITSGGLGWVATWRNVTDLVAPVAGLNNVILPPSMILFGLGLLKVQRPTTSP